MAKTARFRAGKDIRIGDTQTLRFSVREMAAGYCEAMAYPAGPDAVPGTFRPKLRVGQTCEQGGSLIG